MTDDFQPSPTAPCAANAAPVSPPILEAKGEGVFIPFAPERYAAAEARSKDAEADIKARAPWLADLGDVADKAFRVAAENASARSKYGKLRAMADRANADIAPSTVCARGCAGCCHIDVTIFSFEAEQIGRAAGRKPAVPAQSAQAAVDREDYRTRYFGTPCPFLVNGECSIYDARPLACRLHHNLGDAAFCSPDVPPSESLVTTYNTFPVIIAATAIFGAAPAGDIRDFFPGAE